MPPDGELLLVIGPPAVGKMTVARALCARSSFRMFHNHSAIEPLLGVFDFGSEPFTQLNLEFRRRIIEEAARAGTRLMFTPVWNVDEPSDLAYARELVAPYVDAGSPVSFVELYADLETRLVRNRGADRIAAKPSKADLAWSDSHVREVEAQRMNTSPHRSSPAGALLADHAHLRLDNGTLTPDEAAVAILDWLARRR